MSWRRVLVLAVALAALMPSPRAQAPPLQFHHVHLRVADPAAAMDKYTRANDCTSVILQGVGVGVRCGQSYLLFERNGEAAASPVARGAVIVSGKGERATVRLRIVVDDTAAARAWFPERLGLDVSRSLTFVDARDKSSRELVDEIAHVAFGSSDPAPTIARATSSSTIVFSRSDDATVISGPGGLAIELVRDAGVGPDTHWCPMHPDARAPGAGSCPKCGMALVPIPPPVFGDYRMSVDLTRLAPGRDRLSIRLTDPSGQRASRLLSIHEQLLHVFLVSRDLEWFQHVHPDDAGDGTFALDVDWPGPGQYALFADFYPAGGTPQLLQTAVVTPDYRGSAFPAAPALRPDAAEPKRAGALRVGLSAPPLVAGREIPLTFTLADASTGDAVTDLEPYLGAPGHLFVASADLVDGVHSHPLNLRASGPAIRFDVTFPRPGLHKLWVQFQRRGIVITVPFVVEVLRY